MTPSPDIYGMAGHLIRRLHQISTSVFQTRMKAQGVDLTSVQFAALNAIKANPGIDQAGVAGLIAYDRATIGGVIDRLEAKKLVSRVISPRDRRARAVSLTPAGAALLERLAPVVAEMQGDILAGLSAPEAREFLRLAGKMTAQGNHLSRAPLRPKDPE
ncbi:MarR family winged helix-turn-helix transcriptional regulator [Sulfitobacter sabulilitoris]|nr:MarR family transcriptional regulator [Sulfitobacter sabulilitoris]